MTPAPPGSSGWHRAQRRGRWARRGPARQDRGATARRSSSPGSRARCSPTSTPARAARARSPAAELDEGMLTCPSCDRQYFLPRAGRSLDDEKLHLGPVPLLASEDRGGEGGAGGMSGNGRAIDDAVAARRRANVVTGLRGHQARPGGVDRQPKPPARPVADEERCDLCGVGSPRSTSTCSISAIGGSSAPAPPAGPSARAIPSCGRPAAASSGSTTSRSPMSSGRASRCRSGSRSSCTAARSTAMVAMYPSPAGATESELQLAAWEDLTDAQPRAGLARAGCRGARRQPHLRTRRVT